MLHETRARLIECGIEEPQSASLNVAIPIMQGAADEDRDKLVELWVRLLANAMDPKLKSVRYEFIDAVTKMNPMDAIMLQYLYQENVGSIRVGGGGAPPNASIEIAARQLGTRQDDAEVSVRHLHALGFFNTNAPPHDQSTWFTNVMLREFMRACYPEVPHS